MLGPHQAKIFPQNFEQRLVRCERYLRSLAIEDKLNVRFLLALIRQNNELDFNRGGAKPQVS